mgnify:CR=1 FL=1
MKFLNPYKQLEKRWSWFIAQADAATEWRDRSEFFERAWREAENNAEFYEQRNNARSAALWRTRVAQAGQAQIVAEGRFQPPCTCQPLILPDRVLVSGEDDCPIHGFGSVENERA